VAWAIFLVYSSKDFVDVCKYSHHCLTKTKSCFVFLQVESEFVPLYNTYGIGLTTWSPLASGVLTGKYSKGNIPAESRFALDNYKVIMRTLSLYSTRVFLLFFGTGFRILMPPPQNDH
jgi:aryl-alcohol dehydrogenase-like predicted oxidoreductase